MLIKIKKLDEKVGFQKKKIWFQKNKLVARVHFIGQQTKASLIKESIHKLRRHKKLKNFYPEFVRNKRPNVAIDLDQNASFEQNF